MKKESFHYIFQITKLIIFNVSYYRLGSNCNKYFATNAALFCRNKKDFNQCGQCQDSILFGSAKKFYKKWNYLHCKDLSENEYNEILDDLKILCDKYNYIQNNNDNDFSFWAEKDLSMLKLKADF